MTTTRRLTLDSVLMTATATANKHLDAQADAQKTSAELNQAVAATWELVKGRLVSSESASLDALITKIVGKPASQKNKESSQ